MNSSALVAWVNPRSVRDLERFWRSAGRWAGSSCGVDGPLLRLGAVLAEARRTTMPAAYRAQAVATARTHCRYVWDVLVEAGLVLRDGSITEAGRLESMSLARAARRDGGLAYGDDGPPVVEPIGPPMPTAEEAAGCGASEVRRVPPVGEPVRHRPNPAEGWERVMGGGHA